MMVENYSNAQYSVDANTRIRDLEEKTKILRERILLVSKNLVDEREKTFNELQETKKILLELQEKNIRMEEFLQKLAEQNSGLARKEELMILKRQFDMIEPHLK
jgi:hypothetical protein